MACYHPITGYRAPGGKIKFSRAGAFRDLPITIPCGQCIGCRLEKSRQWAARCMHESHMHSRNAYITLTYSDDCLPPDGSLRLEDWQLFAKRYRNALTPEKFRFFQCGEYGDQSKRAHHHALIFGQDFAFDQKPYKKSKGHQLYTSKTLDDLWQQGQCFIGELTFQSAAYVARYVMKKITGPDAADHYSTVNTETGEVTDRKHEFISMSKKPGIGSSWIKKYMDDVYPSDEMVVAGKITRPPKYYDQIFEKTDPQGYRDLLKSRAKRALVFEHDNTPDRRHVKETVKEQQIQTLTRDYDA